MTFLLTPGNAIAIRVNAHRHGWDGSICNDPTSWSCLADPRFQERYCARGLHDCFHLGTFSIQSPSVVIEENGGAWIFEKDPRAFDDQLLFFWTQDFEEPRGVREGTAAGAIVIGAYRVKSVEAFGDSRWTRYRVQPHADGWARFHGFRLSAPYMRTVGGPYVKQIDRTNVRRIFSDLRAEADRADAPWYSPEDKKRLANFDSHLDDWLEKAHRAAILRAEERAAREAVVPMSAGHAPFAGLRNLVDADKLRREPAEPSARPATAPAATPAAAPPPPPARSELVEPGTRDRIKDEYGRDVLISLQLGAVAKPLIVIRGNPGVGKSHLALRLLDDPARERTLVVPVSATWRGPEDLLGYVNPIDHRFETTPFSRFLLGAEAAWRKGDKRARVVVFEEFNLSQPEHWFADLLALTQFTDENDRVWRVPAKLRDMPNKQEVFVSPALYFVATVNTDHTTRPLSPRVLDRAAVIHLELDPRRALARAGLELDEEQLAAVLDLDDALRGRGVSFSIRSALSLAEALRQKEVFGLDAWGVLDLVLEVEVLGKVRLHARDPYDEAVRKELARFQEAHGKHLPRAADRIQGWQETLAAGRDVVQA